MAVEVSISPRLSFSHDIINDPISISIPSENEINRSDQFLVSPSFHFNFSTTSNLTPADELFSNGKILPTKPKIIHHPIPNSQPISPPKKQLKELIFHNQEQQKSTPKSFWKFTRSASLNCDNGKGPKGLLRSLSIKSLSRSNSTGSALTPKGNGSGKGMERSKELKRCSSVTQTQTQIPASSSSFFNSHMYYSYQNSNGSRNSRGGIRVIPVLNIPPAYNFSKGSISFFGFGSLLCNGKAKKKTKT